MEPEDIVWHPEVLSPETHQTLALLSGHADVKQLYLAEGTALALWWGHRTSVDLDFFGSDFLNEDLLLSRLQTFPGIKLISKAPETLHLHVGATKVSFLGYHYPTLFPLAAFGGTGIADPRDIAAMKLNAIASRGTKRDFIDLYMISTRYGLDELLTIFELKFASADYNAIHVLKSLTYFDDAEKEPMPHMLQPISWDRVKEFFAIEAPRLRIR